MPLKINALSLFILPRLLVQVWEQSDSLFEKDPRFYNYSAYRRQNASGETRLEKVNKT